jgi:hypothetical protein
MLENLTFYTGVKIPPVRLLTLLRQAVAYQIEFSRYHPKIIPKIQTYDILPSLPFLSGGTIFYLFLFLFLPLIHLCTLFVYPFLSIPLFFIPLFFIPLFFLAISFYTRLITVLRPELSYSNEGRRREKGGEGKGRGERKGEMLEYGKDDEKSTLNHLCSIISLCLNKYLCPISLFFK